MRRTSDRMAFVSHVGRSRSSLFPLSCLGTSHRHVLEETTVHCHHERKKTWTDGLALSLSLLFRWTHSEGVMCLCRHQTNDSRTSHTVLFYVGLVPESSCQSAQAIAQFSLVDEHLIVVFIGSTVSESLRNGSPFVVIVIQSDVPRTCQRVHVIAHKHHDGSRSKYFLFVVRTFILRFQYALEFGE